MPLEDHFDLIKKCLRCSVCKWIPQIQIKSQKFATSCPSIDRYNFHSYSGGGRIIVALSYLMNRIEPSDKLLDVVYKCTLCRACSISCQYLNKLDPQEVIQEFREKLVEEGKAPLPVHNKYIENTIKNHNPYGEPAEERLSWLPNDVKLKDDAKLAYFVGCTSSYRRKEIAIATARVLNAAGVEFTILGSDEFCCGSPLLRAGAKEDMLKLMKHNIETIQAKGIEEVIMSCAGCYSTFKADYPKYMKYNFKITHSSEFFANLINEGKLKLKKPIDMTVTYHDPCHLGRCSEPYKEWHGQVVEPMPVVQLEIPPKPRRKGTYGVYEPPREVLMKIPKINFVEMERIKEYSYCCGAGGGVKAAYPDFALYTAKTRLEEVEATGAEACISTCPFCSTNLKDAIKEKGNKLKFYDLSELILEAL
ncbi:MAG: (Fe-S)-binding protein [Candidatus Hodarchaeota archaeon]